MSQTVSFGVYTPAERPSPHREHIEVWLADGSVEFAVYIDGSFRYRAEEDRYAGHLLGQGSESEPPVTPCGAGARARGGGLRRISPR